jgi:hypothetical protein
VKGYRERKREKGYREKERERRDIERKKEGIECERERREREESWLHCLLLCQIKKHYLAEVEPLRSKPTVARGR